MLEQELKNKIIEHIKREIPNFELVQKKDSYLMKFLNFFIQIFNKNFMDGFITSIYPKIYCNIETISSEVLAHEYVHLKDRKNWRVLFNLLYLSPQIFGLLMLLSFFSLWFLVLVVCLLPLPSLGRAYIEYRGYSMSMAMVYWTTGEKIDIDWIVKQFTSSSYYYMFPFKTYLINKFEKQFQNIENNVFHFEQMEEIYNIIKESKLLVR